MSGAEPLSQYGARVDPRVVRVVRPFVRALERRHPTTIEGVSNLPRGPAVLVGNHGILGFGSIAFVERLYAATGRLPLACADRCFFLVPGLRDLLTRIGVMYGTPENAKDALGKGAWVVCYPGGAREALKRTGAEKYRLFWRKSVGFVRLARACNVPIVPFAGSGIDDVFDTFGYLPGTGRLIVGHDKYDLPLLWGRGPLARAVPYRFRIGEPIDSAGADEAVADDEVHRTVWSRTQALVDELRADALRAAEAA